MIDMSRDERMLKCMEELAELQRIMTMNLRFDARYSEVDLIKELADAIVTVNLVINSCHLSKEVGRKIYEIRKENGIDFDIGTMGTVFLEGYK